MIRSRTMWALVAACCLIAGRADAANTKHHLTLAQPNDDISGVGVNAGLTFNFGELK